MERDVRRNCSRAHDKFHARKKNEDTYLVVLELQNTWWELHRVSKKKYARVNFQIDYQINSMAGSIRSAVKYPFPVFSLLLLIHGLTIVSDIMHHSSDFQLMGKSVSYSGWSTCNSN